MDRDKLIQRLRATFSIELREHVEVFNRELLALERGGTEAARAESIKALFRTAHSLKGAARAVNAGKLEAVCHNLEELLQGLRDGSRQFTPAVFETLFSAVDTFEETGREINAGLPAPVEPPSVARPATWPTGASAASGHAPTAKPVPQPSAAAASTPGLAATSPNEPPRRAARAAQTAFDSAPPAAPKRPIGTGAEADALETYLRVPEHKLDALLAGNSELLIARRRFDARQAELAALNERVTQLRLNAERAARGTGGARRENPSRRARGNVAVRADPRAVLVRAIDPEREQLLGLERSLESYAASLAEDLRALERAAQTLDERIHQVRMLPFGQACDALHRAVRDLATREGKPTELAIQGGEIELDRSIVDGLRSPLLHLVRNAIDHGIESASERSANGKPARANLTLSAALRGNRVEVTLRDDGRGIDLERIRERMRLNGMPAPVDDQAALRTIFEAGFSTAQRVTDVSGRGVGLDVVRSQIEGLRGNVAVTFEPGRNTCFCLTLPLTVTTLRALLVRSGAELFALPSASIEKLMRAGATELAQLQGRDTLLTEGAPLPLVALAEVVGTESAPPTAAQDKLPIVILGQPGERVALAVDELIAEQDVVVKSLGKRVRKLRHIAGATLLPNGRVALLLHAGEILRTALKRAPGRHAAMFEAATLPARKRILLVDDSATTRTLEKSILEAAGFEIMTAVDGVEGWQILQEHGADLLVSDVEMPNMSGVELTQTLRGSKRFRELPVILLTSLESEQARARGLESGADAYLVKSAFDQSSLLDTIRQLL